MNDQPKKPSDFSNIDTAGSRCVGCGRSSNEVMLMRLRSYARSLACASCFIQYSNCANENPAGTVCGHEPMRHLKKTGACQVPGCGCPAWIHQLESEMDRQYAACVGLEPRVRECESYGANLGKCGRLILIKPDGTLPRLCDDCEKRWVQENAQNMKEVTTLLDMKIEGEPN